MTQETFDVIVIGAGQGVVPSPVPSPRMAERRPWSSASSQVGHA